jgi:hypothetical protein
MWAIVDLTWTKQLADWIGNRRVLEVMSGVGWLAAALRHHKVNLVATDSGEWQPEIQVSPLTEVLRVDAVTAINHFEGSDLLLISWPPSDLQLIQKIATAWGSKPIIYIGERGGVNAPKRFFDRFVIDSSIQIENPKWFGMNDQVLVGTYQS